MAGEPRVVVAGASLAGLRAAEQLRAAGHAGPVTVVGDERHLPYTRPPLTKEVLRDAGPGDDEEALARLHRQLAFRLRPCVADVTFLLGRRVAASDLGAGTVTLDDGTLLGCEGVVAATGLQPRRLNVPGPARGRYAIRTLDDALSLRAALRDGPQVVVVGAGFIGCEAASSLCALGLDVTVVEAGRVPFGGVLGDGLGAAIQRHLEAAGVRFILGAGVTAFAGGATVTGVQLADGRTLAAAVVIEAVGSRCNTGWLAGNGLDLSDGVLTRNDLSAGDGGAARLVAAGDVARFPNPLFDDVPRRVEHWSMPAETARRAAGTLVAALAGDAGPGAAFAPVPSFWSDLPGLRVQSLGSPALGDDARVAEGTLGRLADGVLLTYHRGGTHVGTVTVNLPPARQRELRQAFARDRRPVPAA